MLCFDVVLTRSSAVDDDESYVDTLVAERRRPITVVDGEKVPLNEGLLLWQPTAGGPSTPAGPAAPQCAVLDVISGEYRPLMSHTSAASMPYANRRPTALLFWSQRSASSRKYLGWFVDFARHHVLLVCVLELAPDVVTFTANVSQKSMQTHQYD